MKISNLTISGVALLAGITAITACSSDPDPGTDDDGSGGTGQGGSVVGPGPGPGPGPGAGGSGGGSGDGNDSFAEAQDIALGMDAFGTLEPITSDEDYYKFSAQAGDMLFIDTAAKPDTDPFAAAYPDVVVTVYNSSEQQVAQNDDPYVSRTTNDSQLYYLVPTTGEYYIRVSDCNNVFSGNCFDPVDITNFDYGLRVSLVDPSDPGTAVDDEAGDTVAEAIDLTSEYSEDGAGSGDYFATLAYGTFNDTTDVDVYQIHLPANINFDNALFAGVFLGGPQGTDGSGSTTPMGDVWIQDGGGNILARVDNTVWGTDELEAQQLRAPATADTDYFLFVTHPGDTAGSHDYYYFLHNGLDTNPLEAEAGTVEGTNDLGTGIPEGGPTAGLDTEANGELQSFFVGGNFAFDSASDAFLINVPTGTFTLSVACGAQRSGSGVRGMNVEVFAADGSTSLGAASAAEDATTDLEIQDLDYGSETQIIVNLTNGTNDATVTSRFYQCGVHFVPPTP